MNRHARCFLLAGALAAALSIALGAAAAHAWAGRLAGSLPSFQTAIQHQQLHALGLLAVGILARGPAPSRWLLAAGWLMLAGLFLFCGTLYLRSLADVHTLRALTPYGGGAFLLAWLALAIAVLRAPRG